MTAIEHRRRCPQPASVASSEHIARTRTLREMADSSSGAQPAPKMKVVVPLTTAERTAVLHAIAQLDGKATQKKLRRKISITPTMSG